MCYWAKSGIQVILNNLDKIIDELEVVPSFVDGAASFLNLAQYKFLSIAKWIFGCKN
jgi:hypothetical protein